MIPPTKKTNANITKRALAALMAATAIVGAPSMAADSASNATASSATKPAIDNPLRVHGTIVDVAVSNPAFSTLVAALTAADLVTTLQGPGPFTVFAPTNDAFAKVPPAVLNLLLSDKKALTNVLLYHVIGGRRDLSQAYQTRDIKTVQGQEIYAEREGSMLSINNSTVKGRPIVTDNGIIYVIDSVLLPQYR
jgi:uncharacterized surface protein with fasciclin (FAS1) repeats